ncbi:MAG: putative Alpha/beta fold family hydrolase [Candidatus Saccharibacteria bacterium]|nr:putative Alpha/beta fold family hydrolase [Candidatus Saccharibacteria bacterium]
MKKEAWLLHGTGGSNTDYFWFEDTKKYLEERGYSIWWPLLPHTDKPNLIETRNFIEADMPSLNAETVIVAHSSACPVVLHLLQYFMIQIKQVVLVSGFYQSIDDEGFSQLMLQDKEYDWDAIKAAAKEIILINSDNDPWGCDDVQARPVAEKLGAKFILAEGQGHMGSGSFNQAYREFPLLKGLLAI